LVPPDLRGWVDRVIGVVQRSLVPLLIIQLGAAVVSALISYTVLPDLGLTPTSGGLGSVATRGAQLPAPSVFDSTMSLIGLIILLGVTVLAQGASVFVAVRDAAGRRVSSEEALRFAARRAPALIGWGLFAGMLFAVGAMLIVPALYFAVVFGAALTGVVTIERGPLGRCFQLVNRRFWPTTGRMAIAIACALVYGQLAGYLVKVLSQPGSLNEALLGVLVSAPLGMGAVGVGVVTYAELRFHETGLVLTPTLAEELDR
jgi:hypothetical protein